MRMSRPYVWLCVTVTLYSLPSLSVSTEETRDKMEDALRMLKSLESARQDITSIKRTVNTIDGELAEKQKRTCRIGLANHFCSLADLDSVMKSKEWLNSIYSPGKRSAETANIDTEQGDDSDVHKVLEELVAKRVNLAKLRNLLDEAHDEILQQRKRTCRIQLGGACPTEWASAIADQYYYLMGPHSPGRRKRSPFKFFNRNPVSKRVIAKALLPKM